VTGFEDWTAQQDEGQIPVSVTLVRDRLFQGGRVTNLFTDLPAHFPNELLTTLLDAADVRIERIVSHGHASPADFWYHQAEHEWVIVLRGAARLQFEDGMIEMKAGHFLNIPASKKHRVDWTTTDEATVWLAVRYRDVPATRKDPTDI